MALELDYKFGSLPTGDKILTVDTGMNTGYALWSAGLRLSLLTWGGFRAKGRTVEERLKSLLIQWCGVINKYSPRYVYLEGQQFWAGNATSYASVASTDLFKLSYITGVYFGGAVLNASVKIINTTEWKGQLTKSATALRVRRALSNYAWAAAKMENQSEHIIDAIGMGLSLGGIL